MIFEMVTAAQSTPQEQPRMTKNFESSDQLSEWLSSSLNQKLYKVIFVDWERNPVKLEGRQLPASVGGHMDD